MEKAKKKFEEKQRYTPLAKQFAQLNLKKYKEYLKTGIEGQLDKDTANVQLALAFAKAINAEYGDILSPGEIANIAIDVIRDDPNLKVDTLEKRLWVSRTFEPENWYKP